MNESARGPGIADSATDRAKASWRRRGFVAALSFLLPGVVLVALYARALDYDYAWTDTSAIGQRTMLRPSGEIALAFREPLHRIPHRGAIARQNYYRPLQARFAGFLARHGNSGAAKAIVAAEQNEIALYERNLSFVGYGYFVAKKVVD